MVYHNRAKEREKQASPLEGLGEAQIEAWIERLRGESWLLSVSLPDAKERMPGAEPLGCSPSKIWDIALFSVAKKPGNNQKSPLGDKRINKMQYIHVVVQSLSHVWLFATSWTSMPDFPVLHYLPEFVQTRVHWVDDAIQPYHPSVVPFSSCPQSFPASESFPKSWLFASGGHSIGASPSAQPSEKKKRTTTLAPGYFWAGNSGPLGCGDGSRRLGQYPRPWLAEDASWPIPSAPTLGPWRQPWIPCLQRKGRTWRNMAMKWRCSLTPVSPVPTSAFFFYL